MLVQLRYNRNEYKILFYFVYNEKKRFRVQICPKVEGTKIKLIPKLIR